MNLIIIGFLVNNRLGEYVANMGIVKIFYHFISRPNNLGAHITFKKSYRLVNVGSTRYYMQPSSMCTDFELANCTRKIFLKKCRDPSLLLGYFEKSAQ